MQFAYHNRFYLYFILFFLGACEWPKAKTQNRMPNTEAQAQAHMHVSRVVQLLHLLCYFVSNSLINKFNKTRRQPKKKLKKMTTMLQLLSAQIRQWQDACFGHKKEMGKRSDVT